MKKIYVRPTLLRHGSVEKITLNMTGALSDGATMGMNMRAGS